MKLNLIIIGFILLIGCNEAMAYKKIIKKKSTNNLSSYAAKRDFEKTSEPKPSVKKNKKELSFVIQKHDASHLHYDLRLQMNDVMVSWAIPKGPPTKVGDKKLAIMTEHHPLEYQHFEGTIPQGEYGGGTVMVWDRGTYNVIIKNGKSVTPTISELEKTGRIEFTLHGKKLNGNFALIRFKKPLSGQKNQWLIIKMKDEPGTKKCKVTQRSALTGRTMAQIAKDNQ